MQAGIIAPTKFLKEYCITFTQYCLPSLVLSNSTYQDFYTEASNRKDKVILDCRRQGWKRAPEDLGIVKEAIVLLSPYLVILPSVMYNSVETLKATERAIQELVGENQVPCLEGTSLNEVLELEEVYRRKGFDTIAIPSHIYKTYKGNKENYYIYIDNHSDSKELLGFQGTLVTSLPVRLGLAGRLLSSPLPTPPGLRFDEEKDEFPMITKRNVEDTIELYKED